MGVSVWARYSVPAPPAGASSWQQQPTAVADLPDVRHRLRAALRDGALPRGGDGGERLLLVVEELTSNALRHGAPPVQVRVAALSLGWLVAVDDAAPERSPVPALDRDPGHGGMGLSLVARLCGAHGWDLDGVCKTIWAQVPYLEQLAPGRVRRAREHARALGTQLVETAGRMSTTLDGLAADAEAAGHREAAKRLHAGSGWLLREGRRVQEVLDAAARRPPEPTEDL